MDDFINVGDMEHVARDKISENAWEFFSTGMERSETVRENCEAYKRIRLMPRALVNVEGLDVKTTLLGEAVDMPIGVAPSSYHKLAHPDGEVATAKGAADQNACFILSSQTTAKHNEVAAATSSLKWQQLYIFRDLEAVARLVKLAEDRGFKALVVTVDSPRPHFGRKPRTTNFPPGVRMELFEEIEMGTFVEKRSGFPGAANLDATRTWESLAWLSSITRLPVVAKGILNPQDAVLAWKHGAKAIIVSNHGGRNLDTLPSTMDVLEEIVSVVGDKIEVYVDGGIRYGSDVFKALALGARAVFVGRPVLWGLACEGEVGVARVLKILKEGLIHTMAFTGCRSLEEISTSALYKRDASKL